MGGENRINEMTDLLFGELTTHPDLDKFFVNVPIDAIRAHQAKFFKVLFGPDEERPTPDELKDYMIATHVRLFRDFGLDETHFDIIGECFGICMETMNVPKDQVEEAFEIVGALRIAFEYGAKIARQERKMSAEKKSSLPTASMNTMRGKEKAVLPLGVPPPQLWLVETLGGRDAVRKWTCALTSRYMVTDPILRETFMLLPYLEMEPYLHNMLYIAFEDYKNKSQLANMKEAKAMTRTLRFPLGLAHPLNKIDRKLFDLMERHFEEVGKDLVDEAMLKTSLQRLKTYRSTMGGSKPLTKTLKGTETAHPLKHDSSETATHYTSSSVGSEFASPSTGLIAPDKNVSGRCSKTNNHSASPMKGINGIFIWLMSRRQAERYRSSQARKS
jgi:truncated hemoglobin YjbI